MQLAEALPGSVAAMMRAAGFTNEKDFFKAVEAGQIMANDVLPKFAVELKKVANTNGALTLATQKTRAEMNRFFNELTKAKDNIFQQGMAEGLNYMFGSFSQILQDFAPAAKAFGGAFKGMVSTVTAALRILLTPLQVVVNLLSGMDISDRASSWLWNVVGAGGGLALLAIGFNKVAVAIGMANTQLLVMMGRILAVTAPLLLAQDLVGGMMGQNSVLKPAGIKDGGWGTWSAMNSPSTTAYALMAKYAFGQSIEVSVKDSELSKVIEAKVVEGSQKQQATLRSEGDG